MPVLTVLLVTVLTDHGQTCTANQHMSNWHAFVTHLGAGGHLSRALFRNSFARARAAVGVVGWCGLVVLSRLLLCNVVDELKNMSLIPLLPDLRMRSCLRAGEAAKKPKAQEAVDMAKAGHFMATSRARVPHRDVTLTST